jgi:enterochelin esterase-like enzyme
MHIDLFNQALQLIISFAVFFILFYEFTHNEQIYPSRLRRTTWLRWAHSTVIVLGSLLFGLIVHFVIQSLFPQDDIPWESVVWSMPTGALIILAGYSIHHLKHLLVGLGGACLSIVLGLLLANNYYHYYPTLTALFDHADTATSIATPSSTVASSKTTDAPVLEQFYQPLSGQPARGTLLALSIPASKHFSPRTGRIYLPPAASNNDLLKLPVVVLLTGYPGKPEDWEQAGLEAIMNDFASKHKGLAPIVAVVDFEGTSDADTECVDSTLGDAETYLVKDVPEYIKQHYSVSSSPADWTIAGYSAGGTCSGLLALRNPTVYQNFMNITGDSYPSLKTPAETLSTLFGGSMASQEAHTPTSLLAKSNPLYSSEHAWYFTASEDNPSMIKRVSDQAALASKAGITTQYTQTVGHHGFLAWKQGYVEGLPWIMHQIRFTQ